MKILFDIIDNKVAWGKSTIHFIIFCHLSKMCTVFFYSIALSGNISPIATVPEVHLAQYKSFAINDMRKANSMRTFTRLKCPPLSSLHEKSIY